MSSSSSSLDPFDTAKEEVVQKLNVVTALYELFHEQKQDGTGDRALSDLIKELKKNCKSVEFYLKDLEGTVKIVEKYGGGHICFLFWRQKWFTVHFLGGTLFCELFAL